MHANVVPANRIVPYTGAFWYAYAASAAYPQNSSTMANTPSTPERIGTLGETPSISFAA